MTAASQMPPPKGLGSPTGAYPTRNESFRRFESNRTISKMKYNIVAPNRLPVGGHNVKCDYVDAYWSISIALIWALPVRDVVLMVIFPELSAVIGNSLTVAIFSPPLAA